MDRPAFALMARGSLARLGGGEMIHLHGASKQIVSHANRPYIALGRNSSD